MLKRILKEFPEKNVEEFVKELFKGLLKNMCEVFKKNLCVKNKEITKKYLKKIFGEF